MINFNPGNTLKDAYYLKRIKNAIEGEKSHPRHHGVKMQAHHIISCEGMKRSGLGNRIKKFGYDINELGNLVFLPCTLQGACHLGVQPHRGNHTAIADQDDYADDLEPTSYHDLVSREIMSLERYLSKECMGTRMEKQKKVLSELDALSSKLCALIHKKPGLAPLTDIARHFEPSNSTGCGCADSVRSHRAQPCAVERNHLGRQGAGQAVESITYNKNGRYVLKPAR